jgi:hypothetical protein
VIRVVLPHVVVFVLTFVVDVCWANYNMTSADKLPAKAALWSMMIVLTGTFSTQLWLANHWVLIDSAAGAFVGTYITVNRARYSAASSSAPSGKPHSSVSLGGIMGAAYRTVRRVFEALSSLCK